MVWMRKIGLWVVVPMLLPGLLFGQRTSASISGVVTDPSGALIPSAHVTATNVGTGAPNSTQSNAEGFYVITNLEPGTYSLHVDMTGFQGYEQKGITLQAGEPMTVNVSLKVGVATQEVTVTGAPPLVDTRSQTLSFAVTPEFTEAMPLDGRNILQLMALAPDTSQHYGVAESNQYAARPEAASGFVTASGEARENSTAFYLDGGLNEDTFTQVANVFPNPDAVQEFTYDTNSYNAKYGGMGGGVVNAVTRGGTNQFHGSAFEYVRNGDVNARNFFAAQEDTLKRNQFGFSLGAPIQKDKTFGFLSFQRTTYRYGTTANAAYGPTAAELQGDWSAIPEQLYDTEVTSGTLTSTFVGSGGTPFPGNQVPTSLYNPISLKITKLVPAGDPITGKITYMSHQLDNDNQWVGRVDRNFGQKLRLSGSFLRDVYANPMVDQDPNNALTGGPSSNWLSTHGSLNLTYSFGPNLVSTVGGTLSRALIRYKGSTLYPNLSDLGANVPNWLPASVGGKESGGYFGWYNWYWDGHYDISRNQYNFINSWTYMRGNHTLDFGGELTFSQSITNQDYESSGLTGFFCAFTGYTPLDFMLGQNCDYEQYGPAYIGPRGVEPAMYASDAWRVRHGLTLNLGFRWEPWLPWADHGSGRVGAIISPAAFASGTHSTRYPNLPPGFLVAGDPGVPAALGKSDWKLLDPRVGVAWDVTGNGKTSIRAGAGIYHDKPFGRMYQGMNSFPFESAYIINDPTVDAYSAYNAAPYNGVFPILQVPPASDTKFPLPLSTAVAFSPDFQAPATAQWNLTVERQLGKGVLLRTAYEASESWHMFDGRDINAAVAGPGANTGNTPQRRPWYPYYGGQVLWDETADTTSYNALALTVEKRMTGNLSFLGGFRWAKCLDESSIAIFGREEFTDARDRMLDRGLCPSDLASQFKMAVVWRVPIFQSLGFAGREVIGGWSMSGIWREWGGVPYSAGTETDMNLDGSYNDRAELIGNPNLPGGRSRGAKLQEWFNPRAFSDGTPGTQSNQPRDWLRGPGFANLDFALIRSFPIRYGPFRETQKIDFRAEFFNILNHPNFSNPDTDVDSPLGGQILSANSPRILQFALKYVF